MNWRVQAGEAVAAFLAELNEDEYAFVLARLKMLEEHGPNLQRPYAGTLRDSRHANMKELRVKYERKQFRILYAFDPEQKGILLVGGDKVPMGEKLWYPKFIRIADDLFDKHLKGLSGNAKKGK